MHFSTFEKEKRMRKSNKNVNTLVKYRYFIEQFGMPVKSH